MTFSDSVKNDIPCNNSTNVQSIPRRIDTLQQHGDNSTKLLDALRKAKDTFDENGCGSKADSKRILIIIASPNSFDMGNIKDIQKALGYMHTSGVHVYSVVVGESESNILMKLSTVPVNLYRIHKYEELHNSGLGTSLTTLLCTTEDSNKTKGKVLTNYKQEMDLYYGTYYKFGYDEIMESVLSKLSEDEKDKFDEPLEGVNKTKLSNKDSKLEGSSNGRKTFVDADDDQMHFEDEHERDAKQGKISITTQNNEIDENRKINRRVKESKSRTQKFRSHKKDDSIMEENVAPTQKTKASHYHEDEDEQKTKNEEESHDQEGGSSTNKGTVVKDINDKEENVNEKVKNLDTKNRINERDGNSNSVASSGNIKQNDNDQKKSKEGQLHKEEELREFRKRFIASILEDDENNKNKKGMETTTPWNMDLYSTKKPSYKTRKTVMRKRDDTIKVTPPVEENDMRRNKKRSNLRRQDSKKKGNKRVSSPKPFTRQTNKDNFENEIERKTVVYTPSNRETERKDLGNGKNDFHQATERQVESDDKNDQNIKLSSGDEKQNYENGLEKEQKTVSSLSNDKIQKIPNDENNKIEPKLSNSIRSNVSLFLLSKLKKKTDMASGIVKDLNNEFRQLIKVLLESMNLRTKSATAKVLAMMVTLYTRDIDNIITVLMELGRVSDKQIERLFLELKGRVKTEANEFTSKLYNVIDEAQLATAPILKDIVKEIILETDVMLKDLLATRQNRKKIPYSLVWSIIDDLSRKIRSIQEHLLEIKDDFPEKELEVFQESFDDFIKEILNAMDVKGADKNIKSKVDHINRGIMDLIEKQLSDEKKDRDVGKIKMQLPNKVRDLTKKLNDIARDIPDGRLKGMIQKHTDDVGRSIESLISGLVDIDDDESKKSKLRDINQLIEKANDGITNEVEKISGKIKPKNLERKVEKGIKKPVSAMLKRMKLKKGTRKAKHVITLSTMLNDDMKQLIDTISIELGDGTRAKENDVESLKKKIYSEIEDLTRELNDLANDLSNEKDKNIIRSSIMKLEHQLATMVEELLETGRSTGDKQNSMKDIVNRMHEGAKAIEDDLIGKGSGETITKAIVKKIDKFIGKLMKRANIRKTKRGKHVTRLTSELNNSIRKLMNSLSKQKDGSRTQNDVDKTDDVTKNIENLSKELLDATETIHDPEERDLIVKSARILNKELTDAVDKLLRAKGDGSLNESMLGIVDDLKDNLDSLNRDLSQNGSSQGRKLANNAVKRINGVMDSLLDRMKVKKGTKKSQHVVTLFTRLNDGVKELIDALTNGNDGSREATEEKRRLANPIADEILERKDKALQSLKDIANEMKDGKEKRLIVKSIKDLDKEIKDMVNNLMKISSDYPEAIDDSINRIMKKMDRKVKSIKDKLEKTNDDSGSNVDILGKKMNNLVEDLLDEMNPLNKNVNKRRLSKRVKDFNKELNDLIKELNSDGEDPSSESRNHMIDEKIKETRDNKDKISNEISKLADEADNKNDHELAKKVSGKLNEKLHKMLDKIADAKNAPSRESERIIQVAVNDAIDDVNRLSRSTRSKSKGREEERFAKALRRANENVKDLVKELLDPTDENAEEQQPKIERIAGDLKTDIHDLVDSLISLEKSSHGSKSRDVRDVIDRLNNELEQFARDLPDTISDPSKTSKTKVKKIMGRMRGINDTVKRLRKALSKRSPRRRINDGGGREHSDVRTLPYNAAPSVTTEYNSFVRIYLSGSKSINASPFASLWVCIMTLYLAFYAFHIC